MSALKFKHFNAEDRLPKSTVFGRLTPPGGVLACGQCIDNEVVLYKGVTEFVLPFLEHLEKAPVAVMVCGTDTDAGKTFVTAGLMRALRCCGHVAQAVKIIQTGVRQIADKPGGDAATYTGAVKGLPLFPEIEPAACLMRFSLPASPHLASSCENIALDCADLLRRIGDHLRGAEADILVFEGSGGLFVPINDRETMLDLMVATGFPVVLVCPNILGALNHFSLSLEAILAHGLSVICAVLTDILPCGDVGSVQGQIAADNEIMIRRQLHVRVPNSLFLRLPHYKVVGENAWSNAAERLAPLANRLAGLSPSAEPANKQESELVRRDRRHLWHPYTFAQAFTPLNAATCTYKNRIVLANGQELVDGMSSWWAAIHGYNHPALISALRKQAGKMPHVMFGGLTHEPAIELGERLFEVLPAGLQRIFFADSGSVAVEVAMKMALQYHKGRGQKKRVHFLTARGGYHGDTLGAMSVCDPQNGMHHLFMGLLPAQIFMDKPGCRFGATFDDRALDQARQIFAEQGDSIAAVIIEPIVQGAGGMWFYHPDYLRGLAELCARHGALLILDEIATGFGRTGQYFASAWADCHPDILCCGKALTGGVLTLAATACTENVADGIDASGSPLMHGPTFMANPLACAVALASLEILSQNLWQQQVAKLEQIMRENLSPCMDMPGVADVRVLGGIGVVEMEEAVNMSRLQRYFVENGVWIRPFNRLIYLMPPYLTPPEDAMKLCETVNAAVNDGIWRQ